VTSSTLKTWFVLLFALAGIKGAFAQQDSVFDPFVPSYFHQLRYAHRGGFAYGPENTLETILANVRDRGMDALEVDVQLTADSQLVIFHDETIERVLQCDQPLKVRDLTLAQIQSYPFRDKRLGEVFAPSLKQLVDTLAEANALLDRPLVVELDFKPHGKDTEFAVAKLVVMARSEAAKYGDAFYHHFFVSSFYPEVLAELKEREPLIRKAFAVNNTPNESRFLAKLAVLLAPSVVRKNDADIFEPNHCWATDKRIERWKKRGALINLFTINSACDRQVVEAWEVAYTTNCPGQSCETDASEQMGRRKGWCKDCAE
jgi:glycerophosphoryl diester phosphodiesterase